MTGDGPNHQQPRTNKRKGKPDISLVLIKRVNLAFWLEGEGAANTPPWGRPRTLAERVTQRVAPPPPVLRTFWGLRLASLSHPPWQAASTPPPGHL